MSPWRWQSLVEPGLRVITSRRPQPPPSPYTYEDFQEAIRRAGRDPDPAARLAFLKFFSEHAAPRLTVEESALQFLAMRIAYNYLPPGSSFDMHVEQDLMKTQQDSYARRYTLTDTHVDREQGVVAYLFEPATLFGGSSKRAIVLFRGTAHGSWRDVLTLDHPEGIKADFDTRGIAYTAFAASRDKLVGWVEDNFARGRDVTLTGHSLGGACAARLLAALEPSQQARCHVITFNAPGLDRATATRITEGKVHEVVNWADLVPRIGEMRPRRARVFNPVFDNFIEQPRSHGVAQLARQQLAGKPVQANLKEPGWDDNLVPIEAGRKWFGRWLGEVLIP